MKLFLCFNALSILVFWSYSQRSEIVIFQFYLFRQVAIRPSLSARSVWICQIQKIQTKQQNDTILKIFIYFQNNGIATYHHNIAWMLFSSHLSRTPGSRRPWYWTFGHIVRIFVYFCRWSVEWASAGEKKATSAW